MLIKLLLSALLFRSKFCTTSFFVHEISCKFHIKDIEYSDVVIYESLTISYTAQLFIRFSFHIHDP